MAERNEYMKAAVDEMEKINADEEKRYRYLMREKREHDEATIRFFEREQGREEGISQGKAESVLELLSELGSVPPEFSQIILEQQEVEILNSWLKLAARANSLEEFERNMRKG